MNPQENTSKSPSGSRFAEPKKTRGRSSAQRSAARARQHVSSFQVEDFNLREAERERNSLLAKVGALVEQVDSFSAELPLVSLMVAMVGYLNWYLISNIPVEISRYTEEMAMVEINGQRRRTATAVVCRQLAEWNSRAVD